MISHPQIVFGSLMLAVAAFVAWMSWSVPDWSRPGIFFSVTVVPSFRESPEAARVRRSYRMQALLHVIIAFGLVAAGGALDRAVPLILGVLWLTVGPLVAVSMAHAKALPHAVAHSTVREASLSPHSSQLPGGWMLQFGPLAILAVVALYLSVHWTEIPDRFAVHWGTNGMPNGYSTRTPMGVYGPLLLAAAIVIMISLLAYAISHLARRVPVEGEHAAAGDFPHRIALFLLGVEYFIAAMFSLVGLLPLTGGAGVAPIVILTAAIGLSGVCLSRWIGRGRLHSTQAPGDGTPDRCWKLGLFYFNPDDAALFVEKRIGIGYTINFARPSAWVVLALTLALPLGLGAMAILKR
jgi:uncharacterized membrane protein